MKSWHETESESVNDMVWQDYCSEHLIFDKFKKKIQGSKAKDDFVKIRQVQVATYLMLSIGKG